MKFNEHKQTVTPSENTIKTRIHRDLSNSGFVGHIAHQEFLVVPLSRAKKDKVAWKYIKQSIDQIPSRAIAHKFIVRRPDFLCVKYGFAIEVDGLSHLNFKSSLIKDESREAEYKTLGISLFTISNDQVYNSVELRYFINSICQFISDQINDPEFNKKYQLRRAVISRARKAYLNLDQRISKPDIGEYRKKNPIAKHYPTIAQIGAVQYSGIRYPIGNPRQIKSMNK